MASIIHQEIAFFFGAIPVILKGRFFVAWEGLLVLKTGSSFRMKAVMFEA